MKSILSLVAVCTVVTLAGCSNNKSSSVSPGAVGEKSNACCADKAACTDKAKAQNVSPGAVGDKSSECQKVCPFSGKSTTNNETVSPGAVGEQKKTGGCCASKAKNSG